MYPLMFSKMFKIHVFIVTIWIQHEKYIQISGNMPSFGSKVLETALVILRM